MIKIFGAFIQRITKLFPNIGLKLQQAGMPDAPEDFIKKTLIVSLYGTGGFLMFLWLVLVKLGFGSAVLMMFPAVFGIAFFYFLKVPDFKIMKNLRDINSEIVFAGRFLIIELESGVSLYNAFQNVAKNYRTIGKYFSDIVTRIDLGTQMEEALNETIESTPSPSFRKILWQIVNSQHTGADISTSLKSVVNNITREQMIEIKEYGRKLNPLAMFYMIIAVILPSIGITMFIVLSTFLNLTLSLSILLVISFFLAFIQFMFLAMIKSSRPSVEL
ncbi:type II secretion system F family protein [Candidatus Woesearchaeota archaeon]|nr:type II secretion system F family protein [Candidatus Woesearchaeota archaeon]